MRTSAKIFWILGVFFLIVAVAYAFITHRYEPLGIETVGVPGILAFAGLGIMIAMALTLAARKNALDSSDDLDGEVSESAGVQGSFSPYSWAPLWASIGAALCFLGVAMRLVDLRLRRHLRHLRGPLVGPGVLLRPARALSRRRRRPPSAPPNRPRIVDRCGACCCLHSLSSRTLRDDVPAIPHHGEEQDPSVNARISHYA